MSQLFEDSESDVEFKTNSEYAKNYDTWRKKEVLNKLKTKYGDNVEEDESSSSDDDEIGIELTEEIEENFYKTLASLKKKDPKIYDKNTVFFKESSSETKKKKQSEDESMYLKDYERKILLEKGGVVSDEEIEEERGETYVEEQRKLRESLKKVAENDDSDNEQWGGMFKVRENNKDQKEKQEADYKAWLVGQKMKLDKDTKASLKPLKEYWNDPNLEDGEKFLRDYILNKRYLEDENADYIPTYDEIVHDSDENLSEDENAIDKQEEFEHKYNFRFEEPDQEFIKRYPRTMENSLRRENDKRKLKRAETKERKAKEKEEKMAELKKLRDLKRKEIEEKIEKLKEITGNQEMAFNDADIDGDFDPEEHDKRMQALFNDDFYKEPEEDQKPKFDLDDEDGLELEPENFDNWTGKETENEPHCEDDDFIMDADYDPKATQRELVENSKRKKKRRKKSKFVEMLGEDRPNFNPMDKTYEEYIDEYYKLDCEDIIDNIPCRFKYRQVTPNSFGLSVEEILVAKDRELNKWCSLKKAVQIRPEHVEKYDQIAYSKKADNVQLKKKLLPSLFEENEDNEKDVARTNVEKGKSGNKDKDKSNEEINDEAEDSEETKMKGKINDKEADDSSKKKRKRNTENTNETGGVAEEKIEENSEQTNSNGPSKKKQRKNARKINENTIDEPIKKKSEKLDSGSKAGADSSVQNSKEVENPTKKSQKKKQKKKNKNKQNIAQKQNEKCKIEFSDARLTAIGLNPKKFKNKMKYGQKK